MMSPDRIQLLVDNIEGFKDDDDYKRIMGIPIVRSDEDEEWEEDDEGWEDDIDYLPLPQEIYEACQEIQKGWSDQVRNYRCVGKRLGNIKVLEDVTEDLLEEVDANA